jgi:beta-N-acetylhexosaminidase
MKSNPRRPRPGLRRAAQRAILLVASFFFVALAPAAAGQLASPLAAPPARPTLDDAALAWVENTLSTLTLRQRVAQLVMPWVRGGQLRPAESQRLRRWVEQDGVGGLIVSRGPASEFAPALNRAQSLAHVPLLIVSDLETGPGMRLTGGTNLPPAMAFGAAADERLAREAGRITGREARAAGIHMTLGPVLDVNTSARNPIINTRAFGDDPLLVARLGSAWLSGAREANLLAAGKHFPGHGSTEVDSHIGLPIITATAEQLIAVELPPFSAAIAAGMEGVLVGHIAVSGLDGTGAPASLSARIVNGLLRTELGFDGLVITDALNMGAITRNLEVAEASIRAILAGADVLLQPPGERAVIDAIVHAVETGRIPRERIDQSARRVLRAKAAAGLHRGPRGGTAGGSGIIGSAAHSRFVDEVAEASLTLPRDRLGLVPFRAEVRRILHVVYVGQGSRFSAQTLTSALTGQGYRVDVVQVGERTGASAFAALRDQARAADLVIASAQVTPREYVGSVELGGAFPRFVRELAAAGLPVLVVSFGSPYLLHSFPEIPTYLLAWSGSAESQRAVARALTGRASITGRLPVELRPHHQRGEGIQRLVGAPRNVAPGR